MGIRDSMNRSAPIWIAVLSLAIIGLLAWTFFFRDQGNYGGTDDVFVSTDDGQTFQPHASGGLRPPYTIDGKEAPTAFVYKDKVTGEQFVGYLVKYKAEDQVETTADGAVLPEGRGGTPPALFKRPGEADWVDASDPANAEEVREIRTVRTSPAGNPALTVISGG